MKFSVCIPNYNYANFVNRTIRSVLEQSYGDFEIIVSDNASTDDSVRVVESFRDPRIRVLVNRANVGFANNLDRAARPAVGDVLLMLSSDDVMLPDALDCYARVYEALGASAEKAVVCSTCEVIDHDDRPTGDVIDPHRAAADLAQRDSHLSVAADGDVYRVSAAPLLKRSLSSLQNPFVFLATAYPRRLYDAVEGYGGGRFVGPDKWFHWRLLSAADEAIFVKRTLFRYRWHAQNQTAQQSQSGALRYLLDQYAATFELDARLLDRLDLSRHDVEKAFVEYDIVRHGLGLLAEGNRTRARRTFRFGQATYPHHMSANPRAWALRGLLALGPLGTQIAKAIRNRYRFRADPVRS